MPPVNLFNKDWRIGTDDFVYSSIVELLFRIGWTFSIGFVLSFHILELSNLDCLGQEYRYTTTYLVIALILQLFLIVNLILLAQHSSRGRIFDQTQPHPRRHVSLLVYLNIVLTGAELVLTCSGTFFAIKDWLRCGSVGMTYRTVLIIIFVVIACTYVILFAKMFIALSTIKPFSGSVPEEERQLLNNRENLHQQNSDLHFRGLRCLMPFIKDESTIQAFKDISKILAGIFHDSELVPSDILAGLLVLHYKNKLEKSVRGTSLRRSAPSTKSNVSEDDLDNLKYFYKYSLAAYGYMWFVLESPCIHFCSLLHNVRMCGCFPCASAEEGLVEGDGCCNCNLAAAKAVLQLPDEEFVVFDNRNRIQEVPHYLAVDQSRKALVISIRGTLSLADMFTDLRGEPCLLSECVPEIELGIQPSHKGHRGMIEAARYVYRRLHGMPVSKEDQQLDRISRVNILGQTLDRYPDFTLVVTGHSLGAGTAAILAFLLRSKYTDRDIKCFAYSPPGGLLCSAAAAESEKFTLSLVVGDDVIPRTSLPNIARLSYDIRGVCERCELAKYRLLGHGLLAVFCCNTSDTIHQEVVRLFPEVEDSPSPPLSTDRTNPSTRNLLNNHNVIETSLPAAPSYSSDVEPLTSTPPQEDSAAASAESTPLSPVSVNSSCQLISDQPKEVEEDCVVSRGDEPMFLPGRIVHLEEDSAGTIHLATKTRQDFDTILVTPRMLTDHLPNYISKVLKQL